MNKRAEEGEFKRGFQIPYGLLCIELKKKRDIVVRSKKGKRDRRYKDEISSDWRHLNFLFRWHFQCRWSICVVVCCLISRIPCKRRRIKNRIIRDGNQYQNKNIKLSKIKIIKEVFKLFHRNMNSCLKRLIFWSHLSLHKNHLLIKFSYFNINYSTLNWSSHALKDF